MRVPFKSKTFTCADFKRENINSRQLALPEPALCKPVEKWTGKQAFSLLLCPDRLHGVAVTLETRERHYASASGGGKKRADDLHMDLADGYVCFRSSELISGRLGKSTLGGGNKSGLFQVLSSDYGPQAAVTAMNRLAKLSASLIGEFGFSIGIDDVTPAPMVIRDKGIAVEEGYARCEEYIHDFKIGGLVLAPGCDADTSLENAVTGELNSIRERAAAACMSGLHRHNSPLIMSQCGSKGSPINIAQMVACVGQQSVGGKRAPNGFRGRTLPHFPRGDRTPEGKGFVANSFYSGLTPTEFFFHTMAGREGLVDTAVKTAETGYMSRRLMKALEDLYVHYDGSVRNAAKGIVQLRYGEDGMDPCGMEGKKGDPVALDRLLALARMGWREERGNRSDPGQKDGPFSKLSEAAPKGRGPTGRTSTASKNDKLALKSPGDDRVLLPDELVSAISEFVDPAFSVLSSDVDGIKDEKENPDINIISSSSSHIVAVPCSEKFLLDLKSFLEGIVTRTLQVRAALGLPPDLRGQSELERLLQPVGLTRRQLGDFITLCRARHVDKWVDPGATVGAFGAQSIGEPGTQMTLKTFHFAGVASMNVTLGVPRIKEIINAARNIATPLMQVELDGGAGRKAGSRHPGLGVEALQAEEEIRARLVKGRLERTTLGEVASRIRQEYVGRSAYIRSKFLHNNPGSVVVVSCFG